MLPKKIQNPEKNKPQAIPKQSANASVKTHTCKVSYMQQVCKNYKKPETAMAKMPVGQRWARQAAGSSCWSWGHHLFQLLHRERY